MIGRTNTGGGGGLNFQVVGNPQPRNPKGNTIWIDTDVKIPSSCFQAEQPKNMQQGDVWISTGTSSQVAFNALKKGTVMVYPISAKQYISGAWADVTAKSYQGGAWVDWITFLLNGGKDVTDITGGWTGYAATSLTYAVAPNVEIANGLLRIYFNSMGIGGSGIGAAKNKIDLTNANTLHLVVKSASDYINAKVGVWTISGSIATFVAGNDDVTGAGEVIVDVSGLSGSYYVGALIGRKAGEGFTEICLSDIYWG